MSIDCIAMGMFHSTIYDLKIELLKIQQDDTANANLQEEDFNNNTVS